MSRGFVREDDQEEAPFIPPRAALPEGVTNYVTPRGLQQLHAELRALEKERSAVGGSDDERRRTLAVINGRIDLLQERIASARLVEPGEGPPEDVRFGCTVHFAIRKGAQQGVERRFTIVGVDEASVKEGRIAFTAPIARALLGARVGDRIEFRLGNAVQVLQVLSVE